MAENNEGSLEEVTVQNPKTPISSVQNFISRLSYGFDGQISTALARANRISVQIIPPSKFIENMPGGREVTEGLTYFCQAIQLPGRMLSTSDINTHGPSFKAPTQSIYDEITMTLLCDRELSQKVFLEEWMHFINPNQNYLFKYREDYIGEIVIRQHSDDDQVTYVACLREAYPVSVESINTGWAEKDFQRVQARFTYRYWDPYQTL